MWAGHRAELHEAPLRIVHALTRYEGDVPLFPPGRFEEAQKYGREYVEEAAAMVREAYLELDIGTELTRGAPAQVLLAESGTHMP